MTASKYLLNFSPFLSSTHSQLDMLNYFTKEDLEDALANAEDSELVRRSKLTKFFRILILYTSSAVPDTERAPS